MQQQFGDEIQIVGVGGSGSAEEMAVFVEETGVSGFAHIADVNNEIWRRYDIFSQPTFAFIDDDGSIEISGRGGSGELADRIEALLAT